MPEKTTPPRKILLVVTGGGYTHAGEYITSFYCSYGIHIF
jgi:hypothetical protein